MPTFSTLPPQPLPIPPGVHLGKIVKAVEKVSERGNAMISMVIELPPPGRERLPCILTFVEAARPVVNAFCSSAGLLKPVEPDVQVELAAHHALGRYLYFKVEHDEDGAPKITRFITREAALLIDPSLAEVKIQPQIPVTLPIVGTNWERR
jgi:hypothetical protein